MSDDKCLFCKIVAGKIPCKKVYEDEHIFSYMDINPVHYGHTLIVPKKHRTWFGDMTEEETSKMFAFAKKLSKGFLKNEELQKKFGATATNIMLNNGKDAGQEVFHVHCHVIPRHKKDGNMKYQFNEAKKCPKFGTKECEVHMANLEDHSKLISSQMKEKK